MLLKFVCCFALAFALVAATPKRAAGNTKKATPQNGERLAGLYIKDTNENGEVRFLGGTGGSNTALNTLITQKQDLLEQLRPMNNGGVSTPIIVNLANLGAGNLGAGSLGAGSLGAGNLGGGNLGAGNLGTDSLGTATAVALPSGLNSNQLSQLGINTSPNANLLPQIVAQGALGANRRVVNRRGVNRRRVNNRRRGANNRRRQVYVIRPVQ